MRKVKKAKRAILEPEAGPSIALKCEGDRNGVRWMFATCRAEFSADPQYTTFAAKHLHSVVILIRFRARPPQRRRDVEHHDVLLTMGKNTGKIMPADCVRPASITALI